jgi:hypothetical protein
LLQLVLGTTIIAQDLFEPQQIKQGMLAGGQAATQEQLIPVSSLIDIAAPSGKRGLLTHSIARCWAAVDNLAERWLRLIQTFFTAA